MVGPVGARAPRSRTPSPADGRGCASTSPPRQPARRRARGSRRSNSSMRPAHAREGPSASDAMRSLSLTRSSWAPRDPELAAVRRQRGQHRQLVDDARHLGRLITSASPTPPHDTVTVPTGSPWRAVGSRFDLDPAAQPAHDVDDPAAGGIQAHICNNDLRARKRRPGRHPECGRRHVARNRQIAGPLAAGRPATRDGVGPERARPARRTRPGPAPYGPVWGAFRVTDVRPAA